MRDAAIPWTSTVFAGNAAFAFFVASARIGRRGMVTMAIGDGLVINYRCRHCGESVPGQLYCVSCDACAGCCHCGKMREILDRIRDTLPEAELGFEVCAGCEECFQLDELCLCCRRCLGCCRCPKPT